MCANAAAAIRQERARGIFARCISAREEASTTETSQAQVAARQQTDASVRRCVARASADVEKVDSGTRIIRADEISDVERTKRIGSLPFRGTGSAPAPPPTPPLPDFNATRLRGEASARGSIARTRLTFARFRSCFIPPMPLCRYIDISHIRRSGGEGGREG
jgi:hypothetical protein